MKINEFLDKVCESIKYKPIQNEILEELKSHMEEIKQEYISNGMSEIEAEENATKQMGDARQIGKKLNKIYKPKLDWKLLITSVVLILFGLIISNLKQKNNYGYDSYVIKNIIYILMGSILCTILYLYDYRKIKRYSNIIYIIASLIMILQFTNLRVEINNQCFIKIWGIEVLPFMIAVPLYIVSIIGFIDMYNKDNLININNFKIKIAILSTISIILVAIQSIEYAVILTIIYLIIINVKIFQNNGKRLKRIILLNSSILTVIITSCVICINMLPVNQGVKDIRNNMMKDYKLIGETQNNFFKENEIMLSKESNYTFIYLLGNMGALWCIALICTIITTFLILIYNIKKIHEQYGKYLMIGFSAMFIMETMGHIITNTNSNIILNVNLPFVTYGTIYFLVNCFNFSILLSIYKRRNINFEEKLSG